MRVSLFESLLRSLKPLRYSSLAANPKTLFPSSSSLNLRQRSVQYFQGVVVLGLIFYGILGFVFELLTAMASTSTENESPSGSSISKEAEKPPVEPIRLPTVEEIRGQDIWNNCGVRSIVSGVMGGGIGLFMGLFLGSFDSPIMQDEMTGRQQFIYTAKQMGRRSWSSAKAFAVMGFIFSAAECAIEKTRAKHDTTNTVFAGCVTGGAISAKGGPKAACAGCAGFAAFSVLIEKFLDRHD